MKFLCSGVLCLTLYVALYTSSSHAGGDSLDGIFKNDVVFSINDDGRNPQVGTVLEIFENGMVKVKLTKLNGLSIDQKTEYFHFTHLSTLSKVVPKFEGFTPYQRVYVVSKSKNHLIGTILRLFENGVAEISWSSKNGRSKTGPLSYWHTSKLWKQVSCSEKIKNGQTVYANFKGNHLVGVATNIFIDQTGESQTAEVMWQSKNGKAVREKYEYWPVSHLASLIKDSQSGPELPMPTYEPLPSAAAPETVQVFNCGPLPTPPPLDLQEDEMQKEISSSECPICLKEFKGVNRNVSFRPCGHKFHFKCLRPWSKKDSACPNCRGSE